MKKKIDAEKFVQWAINDELCKNAPVAMDAWGLIERHGRLGTRVDIGHKGTQGFGFLDGEPHPDAKALAIAFRELPKTMRLPEGYDIAGMLGDFAGCDPYAPKLLRRAEFNAIALVIAYATHKRRPVWDIGKPKLEPAQRGEKGHPVVYGRRSLEIDYDPDAAGFDDLVVVKADAKRGGYNLRMIPRVPCVWAEPAPIAFGEARAEYAVWHKALCMLAEIVADHVGEHDVLPPAAPAAPWLIDRPEIMGRVLVSGTLAGTAPLPLKPKRGATAAPWSTLPSRRKLTAADIP